MLQVKKNTFQVQYIDMNFRQRVYENESIISIMMDISFYPRELDGEIVSGTFSVLVDTHQIKTIKDLENKTFNQEVKVSAAISRNGSWEHYDAYDGILTFMNCNHNHIDFHLESKKNELELDGTATMISLYSTSSNEETLKKYFQMDDFYPTPIKKKIQNREILKYYVKNEA